MLRSMGEQSAMLLAPDEVLEDASSRLEGFVPSSASWSDFGIAAGVMLAHFGPLTALTRLVDEPPEIKPSRIRTMAEKLSRPGMAVRVVITALVLLALAPLLMSGLRLAVLNLRFGDIDAKKQAIDEAQQQVRLYESLEGEAWSMAKVLSDMVSNAPLGIDLQVVRAGTSEGTVVVTGLAKLDPEDPGELVVKMQKDLAETGIFRVDNFAWGETNNFGNQREFDLSLSVVQPHRRARYDVEHDFEQWTLQQRIAGLEPGQTFEEYWREQGLLSGSGAAATPTTPAASMSGGSAAAANPGSSGGAQASATGGSSAQTRTPRAPRFGNTGNLPAGTGQMSNPEDRSATGAATRDIPEVLTEAQIAAMSRPDVQERLERVAEAIKFARSTDDVELQENMQSQFRLLMERLRETRQENR
jgi:hypothetical protein